MATGELKIKITSAGKPRTLQVAKVTATIGGAAHADVRLAHPSVEAEHARLWIEGGRLWLQDLGSRYGTFLNGTRLPVLKPMLVRPTDVLTCGQGEDQLTFFGPNASPVRAPRVSAPPPEASHDDHEGSGTIDAEYTMTDVRPSPIAAPPESQVAREERARLARELAELRLQLQMAELERTGAEDLRKRVNQLRAEIQGLGDQGRDLTNELARRRDEETDRRRRFEAELTERRAAAELEIREMRDVQGRKLGHWKLDSVGELNRQAHGLLLEKVRQWVTRPLSHDMVLELEHELDALFRGVLLEEDPHGGSVGEITRTQINAPAPAPAAVTAPVSFAVEPEPGTEPTVIARAPAAESQIRLALESVVARRPNTLLRRVVTTGLVVAVLGLGLEVYRVTHAPPPAPAPRAPASAPAPWRPEQDRKLKNGYVEDVVHTEGYAELMTSVAWQNAWTAELGRAAAPWKVDAQVITTVAEREVNLVAELRTMRDRTPEGQQDGTLLEMRAREAAVTKLMLADFGGNQAVLTKYLTLKRALLARLLPH